METFSLDERIALLTVKGVGPGVVARLESIGISTLQNLAGSDPRHICEQASADTGSTCWRNSPLAQKAITDAISFAREKVDLA
jgi:predicted RecB family nuclease